ncbi:restriction endonuclease subunit S [Clostridium lacusfryxellense]|uniref:restriction endonuclease subunit S n=1 Tax=Clostridium lacusfryxellense TaxID=205328 RepID=UPI001C0D1251|nr:restriction endonuclease subunit S [Clostridium lacusfryxellense]MBU3114114.1 restriction endonuclease subunit S [Clostridium lacusfryxellense]
MKYVLAEIFEKPKSGEWGKNLVEGEEGIKVIRTTNFTNLGKLDYSKIVLRNIDTEKYKDKMLKYGDVIIEKSGGSPSQPVGRVVIFEKSTEEKYYCNNFTAVLRPTKLVNYKYSFYLLKDLYNKRTVLKYQNKTTGIINLRLNDYLQNIEVILPNIEIQQKIAQALDKAQELIDKRKAQIEALGELLKSIFYDMFGDPILNNKLWERVKVIDVCDCMVPGRDKPKSFTGDIPWITIEDLNRGGVTYKSKSDMALTIEEIGEVKRKTIPKGSVILSCVGNLGITSIAGKEMIINQQLHSFQCKEKINNYYLCYVLPYYKGEMERMATSTTVLYMNKTTCNFINIILPPIDIQDEFEQIVETIEKQKELLQQSLNQLESNFNSIMQKAFKGELFN